MVKEKDTNGMKSKEAFAKLTKKHKEHLAGSMLEMVSSNAIDTPKEHGSWRKDMRYDCDQGPELLVLLEYYLLERNGSSEKGKIIT